MGTGVYRLGWEDLSMTGAQIRKIKSIQIRRLARFVSILTLGVLANSPAEAQTLDGTAVEKLALPCASRHVGG